MADTRRANVNWSVCYEGRNPTFEGAILAVLMDIRARLDVTNRALAVLECPNFVAIPATLTQIKRNTAKPRKTRRRK